MKIAILEKYKDKIKNEIKSLYDKFDIKILGMIKDKIIIKYVEQYTIQNKGDSLCLEQNI